jgi:hypothetical protein
MFARIMIPYANGLAAYRQRHSVCCGGGGYYDHR